MYIQYIPLGRANRDSFACPADVPGLRAIWPSACQTANGCLYSIAQLWDIIALIVNKTDATTEDK
jgi:hypothetical protein